MATDEELELESCIPAHIKEEEMSRLRTQMLDYFQLSGAGLGSASKTKKQQILSQKYAIMFEISDSLTGCISHDTFKGVARAIEQKYRNRVKGMATSTTSPSKSTRNALYEQPASLQVEQLERDAIDAWDLLECLVYNGGPRLHRCISTSTFQLSERNLVAFYVCYKGKLHPFTAKMLVTIKHRSACFAPQRAQYHAIVDLLPLLERGGVGEGGPFCPGIDFSDVDTTRKAGIFPHDASTTTSSSHDGRKPPKPPKPATSPLVEVEDLLEFNWGESSTNSTPHTTTAAAAIDPFASTSQPPQCEPPPIPPFPPPPDQSEFTTSTSIVPFAFITSPDNATAEPAAAARHDQFPAAAPARAHWTPLLAPPPAPAPAQVERAYQKRASEQIAPSPTGRVTPGPLPGADSEPFAACVPSWFTPAAPDDCEPTASASQQQQQRTEAALQLDEYSPPPVPLPLQPEKRIAAMMQQGTGGNFVSPIQQLAQTPVPAGVMQGQHPGNCYALVQHNFWTLPPLPSDLHQRYSGCGGNDNDNHDGGGPRPPSGNSIDVAYDHSQRHQGQQQQWQGQSYQSAIPDTPLSRLNWKHRPPLKSLVKKGKQSL